MTPAARVAAAIAVLDEVQSGAAAEQALTRWARASRFAGSKDRAAVRDHVFDVVAVAQAGNVLADVTVHHDDIRQPSGFDGAGFAVEI